MAIGSIELTRLSQLSEDRYREAIVQILQFSMDSEPDRHEIETQVIFDTDRDRYLLLGYGWRGQERVYGVWIHLEIRHGKIWIQRNQTEIDLEAELTKLGIPQAAIVLGIIPPSYRELLDSPS
jgi:hypothetical protein